MVTINIRADESLWRNGMLPEGFITKWLVADGDQVREGHGIVAVRIEGAVHDIVAPRDGRVKIEAGVNHVVEPGSLLATLVVG